MTQAQVLSFVYITTAKADDVLRDIGKCAPISVGVSGKLATEARLTPELICKSMLSGSMAVAISHSVSQEDYLAYVGRMYRLMRASQQGQKEVQCVMEELRAEDARKAAPPAVEETAG